MSSGGNTPLFWPAVPGAEHLRSGRRRSGIFSTRACGFRAARQLRRHITTLAQDFAGPLALGGNGILDHIAEHTRAAGLVRVDCLPPPDYDDVGLAPSTDRTTKGCCFPI